MTEQVPEEAWRILRNLLRPSPSFNPFKKSLFEEFERKLTVSADRDEFINKLGEFLKEELRQKGIENVEVTGGPWRGYDVLVDYDEKRGAYTVDFYSPLRGNLHRLIIAYNYAIGFIEGAEKMRRKRSKLAE